METPYQQLGGDAAVRALVERFYALMDGEAAYAGIRALHPPLIDTSVEKLYLFLSGYLGGPALYVQKIGPPMLRARHLPFRIGESERDQWLACMQRAMEECAVPELLRLQLMGAFQQTADWMRNRPG